MSEYVDYSDGAADSYDYGNIKNNATIRPTAAEEATSENKTCFKEASCAILLVISVAIFLLGVCGNAVVIWIAGFKMKKTVNTTWYLSLAVSDFIFCVCLPFTIAYTATENWMFGQFMCKFTSFVMFLNMFSSIFLLVLISVDRCLTVVFPVWAQNNRTLRRASTAVLLAWAFAAALSIPALVYRDIKKGLTKTVCFNNFADNRNYDFGYGYDYNNHTIPDNHIQHDDLSDTSNAKRQTLAVSRFVSGFVLPMIIIGLCYAIIIIRLWNTHMSRSSNKPFKVMTALIAVFFISWLPYHVFILLEINLPTVYSLSTIQKWLQISVILASANSCLNPLLYSFMGKDFKQKCWSFISKIESAFEDELRSDTSKRTSLTPFHSRNNSTCV